MKLKPQEGQFLITGASGYVGGRLLPRLGKRGLRERCLARRPEFLVGRAAAGTEVVEGDVLRAETLGPALDGMHAAYYMVHSMGDASQQSSIGCCQKLSLRKRHPESGKFRRRTTGWVKPHRLEGWGACPDLYTVVPDNVSAGRLAFDHEGHVYVSIGEKASYDWVQWLDKPTGKIHRVRDDGSLPADNPFAPNEETSTAHTVWSYGHRTPQGLATHPVTGEIWGTEMGPRGGDEVNLIVRGGNYGWPMFTHGLDYNGEPVTIGQDLGLELKLQDTLQSVVDFTPAPAISSFEFYRGTAFPAWENDLIVGSLRARTLYRLRIEDGQRVDEEKLLTGLARIRDVEIGADGFVYLLLEHGELGTIVRLVPSDASG